MIVMVRSNFDPDAQVYLQQSQILLPMDNPGVKILSPMHIFGNPDAPHGHVYLKFENCRVPNDNILLYEHRGFEISQGRLDPGCIHHCMRLLCQTELALEFLVKYGLLIARFRSTMSAGVSQWTPLAGMYAEQRTLRLADGPDKVHRMVVARAEIKKYV
jgi:alkylation response protein AidB-like acyl-CoA dehydrogenase